MHQINKFKKQERKEVYLALSCFLLLKILVQIQNNSTQSTPNFILKHSKLIFET